MNKPSPNVLQALERIGHLPLFYPCSGADLLAPIKTFAPYIKEFWFVDKDYFRDMKPEQERPALALKDGYKLLNVAFRKIDDSVWEGRKNVYKAHYEVCPRVVRIETYQHLTSGSIITIHRHRRTGPSALETEIDQLGIFYYRGDSNADGGSKTHWLTIHKWATPGEQKRTLRKGALIFEVLDKLVDGGLIVTDGSMCMGKNNPYRELQRFHSDHAIKAKAVNEAQQFTDPTGRKFHCIGYAGECYRCPTLIWQVSRPHGENSNE